MAAWHGRRWGPLLTMWVAACAFAAALIWLQFEQPALDDIFPPLYLATALVAIWSTVKWFRSRTDDARDSHDRRHADRRASRRRQGNLHTNY